MPICRAWVKEPSGLIKKEWWSASEGVELNESRECFVRLYWQKEKYFNIDWSFNHYMSSVKGNFCIRIIVGFFKIFCSTVVKTVKEYSKVAFVLTKKYI